MTTNYAALSLLRTKFSNGNAGKETCIRGHSLTDPANVYVNVGTRTQRQCRTCRRAQQAARRLAAPVAPDLDAKQLARLRDAWLESDASQPELCARFGIHQAQLRELVRGLKRSDWRQF